MKAWQLLTHLRQILAWLAEGSFTDAYVMFNNIPRVKDVRRFRGLLQDGTGLSATQPEPRKAHR